MKLLLLAGGKGERMGDLTRDTNKCLLEVTPRVSIVDHVLADIPHFDDVIDEIVVVVGHEKEKVKEHIAPMFKSIPVTFVAQKKQLGMVDAMRTARTAIGDDDFILMLADELVYPFPALELMLTTYKQPHVDACVGYVVPHNIEDVKKTFSIRHYPGTLSITMMKEKPETLPHPTLMKRMFQGTGHGVFPAGFLDYCDRKRRDGRKVATYVDMMVLMMNEEYNLQLVEVGKRYFNINTPEELEAARKYYCGLCMSQYAYTI